MTLPVYRNTQPLISIVLPTFNHRDYLADCLDSVAQQTFSSWELIIIDDGSTDGSSDLIDMFVACDDRIKVIRHRNKGLPLAMNAGILLSVGRYITFINSDDQYRHTHLESRLDFMQRHPQVDLIHGGFEVIGDPYVPDRFDRSKRVHLKDCALGGTFFGKREVFAALKGFRHIPYGEDSDLVERAAQRFCVRRVEMPTYLYNRTLPDSISNTFLRQPAA